MTIRATGRSSGRPRSASCPRGGYTLLEICIVLFIVALLIGAAAPHLSGWLSEERLRGPARRLELLARTARLDAIDRQCPYEVVIRPGSLSLEATGGDGPEKGREKDGPGAAAPAAVPDPYPLSDSIAVRTKAWGEAEFSSRDEVRWRFQPSGLCEPMWVEFRQAGSVIALGFDPLTASVSEEKYEFR